MTASLADNEIWHVMIADDMKRMNVDQLDDAFRLSLVDGSTMVWKAGMTTWRRLGSVAGIDDDDIEILDDDDELEDSITRLVAVPLPAPRFATRPVPKPPSPRPLSAAPRPVPAAPRAVSAAPRAVSAAPSPRTAPPPPAPPPPRGAPPPRTATPPRTAPPPPLAPPAPRAAPQAWHTAAPAVFQQRVVAPVYTPPIAAPDPFMLPKRRVAIPSEVDFRRKSGGVRWGRWLVALLLLTGGVLAAYRQNLLRDGARRIGLENKYLHGEQRVTAFVSAKAPGALKVALTKLALLPGPNAVAAPASVPARASVPAAQPASPAPEAARTTEPAPTAAAKAETKPSGDPDVKTVSLDSLPVLSTEAAASKPAAAAAPVAPPPAPRPEQLSRRSEPKPKKATTRLAPVEKPAPTAKAEPKAKPAPPPPSSANDSPLKAAIRSAIAADANKK